CSSTTRSRMNCFYATLVAALLLCLSALVATSSGAEAELPRREHIRLNLDWADNWGDWGPEAFCPDEYFATAFEIKVQSYDGAIIDDTAINAIQLICNHAFFNTTTKDAPQLRDFPISSLQAPWGDWR
ncbi:unnamed protein product, partial [Meganyctiphanes norvegica]